MSKNHDLQVHLFRELDSHASEYRHMHILLDVASNSSSLPSYSISEPCLEPVASCETFSLSCSFAVFIVEEDGGCSCKGYK